MRCINAHNVNQALYEGLTHISAFGIEQQSRNGPVWVSPTPVITTYKNPLFRTVFSPTRNANPFFHVMEALWMLAGRNDLEFLTRFIKDFGKFSDDGHTLHGAYGYRWREHFKMDQLALIADELERTPGSRRAVLAMWDAPAEWSAMAFGDAKDIPCNTHAYFDLLDGKLNMTVLNRSNDVWWGAYGANAVHFSFLLEYMAAALNRPVGVYRQFSNNFHVYVDSLPKLSEDFRDTLTMLAEEARDQDRYTVSAGPWVANAKTADTLEVNQFVPLIIDQIRFNEELAWFMEDPLAVGHREPFFEKVASPMYCAWDAYKGKRYHEAEDHVLNIRAADWRTACDEWLGRRKAARLAKAVA